MILDNMGSLLASLFTNVGAAPQIKTMTDQAGLLRQMSAVGWGTIAGRFGLWGSNNGAASGAPYVQLGTGSTPVDRTDYATETPCVGPEGALFNAGLGAGYGSNIVQILQNVGPFTVAQVVREGTVFMNSACLYAFATGSNFWAVMRYNYSPLSVGIGELVAMDTTIQT